MAGNSNNQQQQRGQTSSSSPLTNGQAAAGHVGTRDRRATSGGLDHHDVYNGNGNGNGGSDSVRSASATDTFQYGTHCGAHCATYCATIANRILFHRAYTILYALVFILQFILFLYGVSNYVIFRDLDDHDTWYIACDIIVTSALAVEVIIRSTATWETYWQSCANMVDFVVMVLCVCALFFYFLDPQAAIYGSLVLSIRYASQLIRLILALKSHRDRRNMAGAMEAGIDFSQLDNDDNFNSFGDVPQSPAHKNTSRSAVY